MPKPGLAIIAGHGILPQLLAEDAAARDVPYQVVTFDNMALDWVGDHPVISARFEKIGAMFAAMKAAGIADVVMAGAMARPSLNPLKFDKVFAALAIKLLPALKSGDDAALAVIVTAFEAQGFTVHGAHDLLADLTVEAGILTQLHPDEAAKSDTVRATEIVTGLGHLDVGQGAVVAQGICLGIETIQGTDAMLRFAATGRDRLPNQEPGGVLLKAPKPGQDRRVDLPAIGPETVRNAAAAGLSGIVISAGGVLILGRDVVVAEANRLGLFLWSR